LLAILLETHFVALERAAYTTEQISILAASREIREKAVFERQLVTEED
jgi:hypothetical protein